MLDNPVESSDLPPQNLKQTFIGLFCVLGHLEHFIFFSKKNSSKFNFFQKCCRVLCTAHCLLVALSFNRWEVEKGSSGKVGSMLKK